MGWGWASSSLSWETVAPRGGDAPGLLGHAQDKSPGVFLQVARKLGRKPISILVSVSPSHSFPFAPTVQTPFCALVQASPLSPGRWASTWSASRRMATTWPTAPCPSWWSSLRSGTPAEPKSTAAACQKDGLSRCLTSSWTQGMQVCGHPGERPRAHGDCLFAQAALSFHVQTPFLS